MIVLTADQPALLKLIQSFSGADTILSFTNYLIASLSSYMLFQLRRSKRRLRSAASVEIDSLYSSNVSPFECQPLVAPGHGFYCFAYMLNPELPTI